MNKLMPFYDDAAGGGFVLSTHQLQPQSKSIRCGWAFGPGAPDRCEGESRCLGVAAEHYSCWWGGDQMQQLMMQQQALATSGGRFNKIFLAMPHWTHALPSIVDAIFFDVHRPGAEDRARSVLKEFNEKFGHAVPLLRLDLSLPETPFDWDWGGG